MELAVSWLCPDKQLDFNTDRLVWNNAASEDGGQLDDWKFSTEVVLLTGLAPVTSQRRQTGSLTSLTARLIELTTSRQQHFAPKLPAPVHQENHLSTVTGLLWSRGVHWEAASYQLVKLSVHSWGRTWAGDQREGTIFFFFGPHGNFKHNHHKLKYISDQLLTHPISTGQHFQPTGLCKSSIYSPFNSDLVSTSSWEKTWIV